MSSIAFDSITQTGSRLWRYAWTGTGPYRVTVRGMLYADAQDAAYVDVGGYSNNQPYEVEVSESDSTTDGEAHPPYAVLQWFGNYWAEAYQVWDGTTLLAEIPEDGRGYYSYTTAALDDLSSTTYDVKQRDSAGNLSTATALTVSMVRLPAPPLVDYTYAPLTNTITVSSATPETAFPEI